MIEGLINNILAIWTPGWLEMSVILIVALLIFGKRLPEIARGVGKSLTEFKKGVNEAKHYKNELVDDAKEIKDGLVNQAKEATGLNEFEDNNGKKII